MLRENKEGWAIDRIKLMGLDKWNSLNKLLAMQKVKVIKQKMILLLKRLLSFYAGVTHQSYSCLKS